jgi:hypothetical protein
MLNLVSQNLFWLVILSLVLGIISLFLVLVLFLIIRAQYQKNKALFSGGKVKSLDAVVAEQAENLKDMDREIQELFEISSRINNLAMHSLHKVGVVRYNPFRDLGGDQSFAIALLDGKNSGLAISSLHTREGTRVYAKPVMKGESKYSLTEEEKQAIKIAGLIKDSQV